MPDQTAFLQALSDDAPLRGRRASSGGPESLFGITVVVDKSLQAGSVHFTGDKLIMAPDRFAEMKAILAKKESKRSARPNERNAAVREFFKTLYGAESTESRIPVKVIEQGLDPKKLNRRIKG